MAKKAMKLTLTVTAPITVNAELTAAQVKAFAKDLKAHLTSVIPEDVAETFDGVDMGEEGNAAEAKAGKISVTLQ